MPFHFAYPELLWLLAAIPVALLLLHVCGCRMRRGVPSAACFLAFAILVVAHPQQVATFQTEVYSRHVVVGLADDSGSMSRCLQPLKSDPCTTTYLDMAIGFDKFANLRQTDTVAVTLFSETPLVLTDPSQTRKQTIDALRLAKPRFGTTYPLAALNTAIAQFKQAADGARVLVIMTDGEFEISAQDLESIGKQLNELNVSVHWLLPDWDKAGPYKTDLYKLMGIVHGRIYEVTSRAEISEAFLKIALVEEPRLQPKEESVTVDLTRYFGLPMVLFLLFAVGAAIGEAILRSRETRFDVGKGKVVIVRSVD